MATTKTFLRSWTTQLALVALAVNATLMWQTFEVARSEASQANAAAWWICAWNGNCGPACVPPGGCLQPSGTGAATACKVDTTLPAGNSGVSVPTPATYGWCFLVPLNTTCTAASPCGVNMVSSCGALQSDGTCPGPLCIAGAPVGGC